jgi:hypothetical protein
MVGPRGLVAGRRTMTWRPWVDHSTPDADLTRISCKVIETAPGHDRLEFHVQVPPSDSSMA